MIFRPERLRMILAGIGIVLALAALAFDDRRVTWIAIGVLGAALLLRLVGSRNKSDASDDDTGD